MRVIAGMVRWTQEAEVPIEPLLAMSRRLPVPAGCLTRGAAGFVYTKPLHVERQGPIVAVADLELTNLADLLPSARSSHDGPGLLIPLFVRDGVDFVRSLRGAFALALWDGDSRTLVLAVDHVGIKRLYYAAPFGTVAFASQTSPLLPVPGVDTAIDPEAVYTYLNYGFVPAPASMFRGVRRLPPGHLLRMSAWGTHLERYWDVAYSDTERDLERAATTIHGLAENAVARTFAPGGAKDTGAFLSGGTDSSTVLGLMTRTGEEPIHAFSIGFDEPRYDEREYARLAAEHFGAIHHVAVVRPEMALDALPALTEAYDEPFANSSALGTLLCARAARQCGMRTLLAGDGGDEIFGGNQRYTAHQVYARYRRIPSLLRRRLLEPVLLGLPEARASVLGRAQRYVLRARLDNPRRFYFSEFFFARERATLLRPEVFDAVDVDAPVTVAESHYRRARTTSELDRLLYLDLKLTLGDNDLLKVTRTADLAGIDVRFPFLDRDLVEFTATLPAHFKVKGRDKRVAFKRAFRDLLPPAILTKRKHGFGIPTGMWLKEHREFKALVHDTMLVPSAHCTGYFRDGALERLVALHAADTTPYYGDLLWTVLMLELWHRAQAVRVTP